MRKKLKKINEEMTSGFITAVCEGFIMFRTLHSTNVPLKCSLNLKVH